MLRVMLAVVLFVLLSLPGVARGADYFPPPDAAGGWRALTAAADVRREAGLDLEKLDEAFEYVKRSTKHGGLLVVRRGWLVYERYFGRGHREATPNTASVGKALTSMAVGILIHRRADLFPHGLDQRVMQPAFLPPEAFPLSDPAKAEIKLGQLLAMTAGIRATARAWSTGGRCGSIRRAPRGGSRWSIRWRSARWRAPRMRSRCGRRPAAATRTPRRPSIWPRSSCGT